ncbi:MAG: MFS transporter [Firmicutes bacterium]|nr:MFS transporter [Bacillota bacterium]
MGPVRRVAGEMFASLRHRNYRLFWTGQLISVTGNWMNQVAQGWLVLELSNSSVVLGTVGALQWLPVLFLTAFAGAVADRYPKRRVLLCTQTALLLLAAVLGTLTVTGHVRIWHVMAVATLTGVVNAFDNPTRQSFIVELVGKQDLANAIALNSSLFNAARVVGPSLGGFVIGALGVGTAFLLNALSYVAVLVGLALMTPTLEPPRPARRRLLAEVGEGLAYLRATPSVSWPIVLLGVVSLFAINWNILLPLLAKQVLHVGPEGLGLLYTALGLGALVGALALAANAHHAIRFESVAAYATAFSATQLLVGFVPLFYVDLALLAVAGYTMIRFTASSNSLVQSLVPDGLRARVMSVYFLVFGGSSPFGNEFAGAVAAGWGPRAAFAAGAVLAGTFAAYVWLRETRRSDAEVAAGT